MSFSELEDVLWGGGGGTLMSALVGAARRALGAHYYVTHDNGWNRAAPSTGG